MQSNDSPWGKTAREIRIDTEHLVANAVVSRLTIYNFQHYCDRYGHAVRAELPWAVCKWVRGRTGCLYAEVLRTPHLVDASVIAVFDTAVALEAAATALRLQDFVLAPHLTLTCPPIGVDTGDLETVFNSGLA